MVAKISFIDKKCFNNDKCFCNDNYEDIGKHCYKYGDHHFGALLSSAFYELDYEFMNGQIVYEIINKIEEYVKKVNLLNYNQILQKQIEDENDYGFSMDKNDFYENFVIYVETWNELISIIRTSPNHIITLI